VGDGLAGADVDDVVTSGTNRGQAWWRSVAARPSVVPATFVALLAVLLVATYALPDRQDDEAGYLELARNLTHGHYATGRPEALLDDDPSYPDLWFGPGLPLALAGPVAAGVPVELLRLTGPLFLLCALLVFHALVRRTLAPAAALAATIALGLYVPFYSALTNLHSEPLAVLLLVVSMYAIARACAGEGRRWTVVGGAALAGLALTRVAYGWVLTIALVAFAVWWLTTRRPAARRLLAMTALALALCVPWLAYTTAETGRALQWGNSGALSLYWMSTPTPGLEGDWQQANDVFHDPALAAERPFFASLRGLDLPAQNSRLERRAVTNIVHHPISYAKHVAANVSRMLFDAPYSHQAQRLGAFAFALPNALLLGMLAASLLVLAIDRRGLPPPALPFAILAVIAFGLHALVAAYPRMLFPIVPLLVWFVAIGLAGESGKRPAQGANRQCR
jgi:4-amino-4-deoxy-L-arabinose transferase-like glycosyltransferase